MKRKFLAFMTATMFFMLLLSSTVLAAYQRTADNTVPAYRNSSLTQRTGKKKRPIELPNRTNAGFRKLQEPGVRRKLKTNYAGRAMRNREGRSMSAG